LVHGPRRTGRICGTIHVRAEARRLGGRRFTLDRPLVLALLRSAKGHHAWEAKAKAMLDAYEQAEADRDRGQALSVVRDLRARAIAGWSGGAPVPTTLPFAEGAPPKAYAAAVYAPTRSEGDPTTPAGKFQRNLLRALDLIEEILSGKAIGRDVRDKRLALEAATATIKAAISTDKNMLKAPRPAFPYSLKFPRISHDSGIERSLQSGFEYIPSARRRPSEGRLRKRRGGWAAICQALPSRTRPCVVAKAFKLLVSAKREEIEALGDRAKAVLKAAARFRSMPTGGLP
jgi:hypothetical protein